MMPIMPIVPMMIISDEVDIDPAVRETLRRVITEPVTAIGIGSNLMLRADNRRPALARPAIADMRNG